MAYINVDEVYILDNTGLQVDMATDIPFADAGFTDAQKEQARKNIAAGGTNPNLLDNPFFQVNQRNVANGVVINANGFIADRWQATGTVGATRNADGSITISNTMYYKLGFTLPVGKVVTISALYADGTIESDTFTWTGTTTRYLGSLNATCYTGATPQQINFGSGTKNVSALKLELGSVSTLANDAPPDYGTELRKCQYYFRRVSSATSSAFPVGFGMAFSGTVARILLPVGTMRAAPTVSYTGSYWYLYGNGSYQTVTGMSLLTVQTEGVAITTAVASGLSTYHTYILGATESGSYIDLSADL